MREYMPKKDYPEKLPPAVYYQALYAVRDYNRLRDELKNLQTYKSPLAGSGIHGSGVSDPTGRTAIRISEIRDRLTIIDKAFATIPEEYRQGLFDNIAYGCGYPYVASVRTWGRWRRRLLFAVAKNLGIL